MKKSYIGWVGMALLWLCVIGKVSAQTITNVEYFIDNDPGVNNGTAVTITAGTAVTQTFPVSLSSISLTNGIHRLSVRAKDSNGKWSWVANTLFVKEKITNNAAPIDITKIEYFFNLDPGVGNGIDVPFTAATSLTNLAFTTPLPSLPVGFHYLSVRVKDARNGWTRCISRPFLKEEIPSNIPLPNITNMEYFLDEDPGVNNGTPITFTAGTSVNNLAFTIPLPSTVSAGIHTFSVRAKNANNKWSLVTNRPFLKETIQSSVPLAAINRLEYFFDNDPGLGNGTTVNFTAGTSVNDLDVNIPLPNTLPNGIHNVTIRARDSRGKWSTAVVRPFYKENTAVSANLPNITRLEYFIDTDPGFGNGTAVTITPNVALSNIAFTAALTGLQNGKHSLEIRAKDANNKWSTVGIREFVVCASPFTAAILPATEQNTCAGTPVNLSVPAGYSYQWQLNGANIFNASANTYSATQTGDYTVVVAQNGCQFTTNPVKVNVTNVPSPPTVTTPNQTICSGQSVTLVSNNCSGIVTWSNGSTGGGIIVAPTTSTTYTATCSINGCTSASSSTSSVITVNAALAAPTISGPSSACQNSSVSLTASGCAGIVTWNNGKTGSTLTFVANATGTYSAICASGGCVSVASSPFTVNITPSTANAMALTASSSKICVGQATLLTATGCAGSILWNNGSTTSTISVSPTVTGSYSATCSDNGCTGNSVNTLQIQVVPIPNAPTIYGQNQTICKGTSISLSAYFCTGGVINWSNGFVGQTQSVKPIATTTYTATCTKDGCPSVNSNGITLTVSECQNPAVNITKIEYFIDNDPGFGSGINVPITAASVINDLNISIPIQATFVNGFHNLSIRAKDSNNKWAWTIVRPFWKEALPSTAVLPNIVKLEYFIDNDPGYDAGTNIPITAGTSINNLSVTMPLDNSLVTGWHNLTLRAKNANGAWSIVVVRPFYKDELSNLTNLPNIARLEYFIDTDPGVDLGTEIPITANQAINNIPLVVNMSGLATGSHFLEIRAKDVNGKWSTVGVKKFDYGTNIVKIGTVATDLCGQTNLSLPYTLEGTFNAGNTVKVQLLDVNNNLVNSNLVTQTSITSGTITVPLPNVSVNTIYKLRLVTSDPVLTSDVVQFTLKPTTLPTISAGGATTFCSGGSVSLTASNCTGTVVWSNGTSNNMILASSFGTYSATCNMPNNCSLPTNNSIIVTVNGGGASAPSVSGNTALCGTNNTTTLTASGCSGGTYRWYLNSTTTSVQSTSNPYTTPVIGSTSTFYVACVISSCESSRTPITVNVTPSPSAPTISPNSPPAICAGQSVVLTANGCSGLVTWSNGATGSTNSVSPTASTIYTANCTINGCVSNNSTPVSVTLTSNCNYPITITPSRVFVCPNTPITLSASGCPNTITWTGGATGSSLTVTPTVTGTYTATCAAGGSGNVEITVGATTATLTNTDNIQTGTAKFQVTQTITSNSVIGTSAINPKPNVLYQAGNSILLQPGFSTITGSIFSAKIQGCN